MEKPMSQKKFQASVAEGFAKTQEFQTFAVKRFTEMEKFQTFAVKRLAEMEKFQGLVLEQFTRLWEEFSALKTEMRGGFKELHARIDGVETVLNPLSKAVDTDSEKILDHDKRLLRVEKVVGIKKA
ncbi:hypothetical protein K2Q00_03900 [Patescibacteria group bacterium]|nr:hypothetical protein [Patescibacteria group bacterium]